MRSKVIAAVLMCLFYAVTAIGQSVLESESEIVFGENEAIVRLAVQSDRAVNNAATRLELLDAGGVVRLTGGDARDIATGKQSLEFRMPMGELTRAQTKILHGTGYVIASAMRPALSRSRRSLRNYSNFASSPRRISCPAWAIASAFAP